MDPLIFIGIIVIFSILDSLARKKRTGMQAPKAPPRRERATARTGQRRDVPTYVDYDELGIEEEEEEEARRARALPTSSETLVPKDIWEEIAGLMTTARDSSTTGRPGGARTPGPRTPAPRRTLPRRPARPTRPVRPAPLPEADVSQGDVVMPGERVHLSHREYGTDPSQRSRSAQDGLDPLARSLGVDEATVRQQLRRRSRHALRQAVILQEVLGPPAALRPDRFTD